MLKVLVVAGGGAGGDGAGPGGGAGGVIYDAAYAVTTQTYTVTVGAGGTPSYTTGSNSVFGTLIAFGGGYGGHDSFSGGGSGSNGGSGGGGGYGGTGGGTGSVGQGTNGGNGRLGTGGAGSGDPYCGGGGGGAGAVGASASISGPGAGGVGVSNSITGAAVYYGGGGGGGADNHRLNAAGAGGNGGGGAGGNNGNGNNSTPAVNGTAGSANTGGGGGGGNNGGTGGAGGSGVVIISYVTADFGTCTGGTITTDGVNTVHTFTSSGTFSVVLLSSAKTLNGLAIASVKSLNGVATTSTRSRNGLLLLDADAAAFITATGITARSQISAINTLVFSAKANGWWTRCNAIYPMVGGTATTHKYNLKDPQDTDGAFRLVFNGGWTHASTGALPNGTTGYADTKINMASVLTLNNTAISLYSRNNLGSTGTVFWGGYIGGGGDKGIQFLPDFSGTLYSDIYDLTGGGGRFSVSNTTTQGYFMQSRVSSTDHKVYRNGSSLGGNGSTAGGLVSLNLFLSARNDNGTASSFNANECAFFTVGLGISTALAATMYTDIQAYQTALGRQI